MFINKKFILASSSKSRFKILKQNKLNFKQIKPRCDEEKIKQQLLKNKKSPISVVKKLAREKTVSVSINNPKEVTVGCDTIILLNKKMIQKAKNLNEAENKILKMSGKKHKIISAISVYKNKTRLWEHVEITTIEVRKLTIKEIRKYLSFCGRGVLSSVGCYQIEKNGPTIIKNINGDFFNVMGFPLFPFLNFLKNNKNHD
tara:strand:- start:142 stop:744 length:603 start_codon:yes stop_codon:yes gene_type:complete